MIVKKLLVLSTALLLSGCVIKVETERFSNYGIKGNWIHINQENHTGIGLTLMFDGSYTITYFKLTSEFTGNAFVQKGVYTYERDNITLVPREASCNNESGKSYPVYYYFNDKDEVFLGFNNAGYYFQPRPLNIQYEYVLSYGCFDNDEVFSRYPMTQISPPR